MRDISTHRRREGAPRGAHRVARVATTLALGIGLGVGVALGLGVAAGPALAVEPDEMLDDPALEDRAREVSKDLRCVVCQNESIDESNADMARDMRLLVRDRILEGDSNEEVKQYLVDRYGDYVLLKPPFKPTTYVLWFGPLVILVLGGAVAFAFARRKAAAPSAPPPLTPEERDQLRSLLRDFDASHGDQDTRRGRGDRGGAA